MLDFFIPKTNGGYRVPSPAHSNLFFDKFNCLEARNLIQRPQAGAGHGEKDDGEEGK